MENGISLVYPYMGIPGIYTFTLYGIHIMFIVYHVAKATYEMIEEMF